MQCYLLFSLLGIVGNSAFLDRLKKKEVKQGTERRNRHLYPAEIKKEAKKAGKRGTVRKTCAYTP